MSGAGGANTGGSSGQRRSTEDRSATKDAAMQNFKENSQQDRRVYVGNLSYDVKWHHLKDFMKQGWLPAQCVTGLSLVAGEVLFADVLTLANGMSKVGANV